MRCGVGCRHGSDLALLWLWRRLAATVLIRPLTWETPYAISVALKIQKKEFILWFSDFHVDQKIESEKDSQATTLIGVEFSHKHYLTQVL